MDKGQHLRLVIIGGTSQLQTTNFIALATELTLHLSATTEDSTTKDSTDTAGTWNEYDVTGRSGDITFGALVAALEEGDDTFGEYLEDFVDAVSDNLIDWKIVFCSSTNNRTVGKTLCSGKGKLTNLQVSAQNRQKSTYSGTLNIFGAVTVGND